jgi:hypothetical protein
MNQGFILEVSFDVQQISQRLRWNFRLQKQTVPPGTGANTGQLAFECGDTIALAVTGNSHNSLLASLSITQCHLVTRPLINSMHAHLGLAGDYPAPSPFTESAAVADFIGTSGPGEASGTATSMCWTPAIELDCINPGRWEMSLILTAHITLTSDAGEYTAHRVFSFDPECEVGTGIGVAL